ncbi:MAG: hypothetical protein ABR589_05880 [Chthoniobacterales bacterium]
MASVLVGCAQEGVIVQKDARPSPFYLSYDMEGSYTFYLRDRAGAVHRQIVTPDVFQRYAIGDYFNDLQPGESRAARLPDAKEVKTATVTRQPTQRVASAQKARTTKSRATASKRQRLKSAIAKRPSSQIRKATVVRTSGRVSVPKPAEAHIVFITVARCR